MVAEPWVTKHRPVTLDEIVGQDYVVASIKNLLTNISEFPHLLFWGSPGTGKTTMTQVLARQIFGPSWHRIVLTINASNETQIGVVREKIYNYCRTSPSIHDVDRKMIILEEFDGFGKKGQQALREPMEEYADNVLFVMTCNFPDQIIPPLQSRCAIMHFKQPTEEDIMQYVMQVAEKEHVLIDKECVAIIAKSAYGDFRPAINILQTAVEYDNNNQRFVRKERVIEVANYLSEDVIADIMESVHKGDIKTSVDIIDSLMATGIKPIAIVNSLYLYNVAKGSFDIEKDSGLEMLKIFSDITETLSNSSIPSIAMTYFISKIHKIMKGK